MPDRSEHIAVILGPTCSWKSAVALQLAKRHDAEIISCDSMQVYRGLPIGTAQPSEEEQREVPHHLVGCLDIHELYTASRFAEMAEACRRDITSRGRRIIVVGGSGLYAKTWIYGMPLLPSDLTVSQAWSRKLATEEGRQTALLDIQRECAERKLEMPPDVILNPRRLLRACEVHQLTGKFPWELAKAADCPRLGFRQFCLLPDWTLLRARIHARTRQMLKAGWVEEAKAADANGLLETPTARQALGYRDILEFLQRGAPGGEEALAELLGNRTVQYARRQMTWFKHQHPGAVFLPLEQPELAVSTAVKAIEEAMSS